MKSFIIAALATTAFSANAMDNRVAAVPLFLAIMATESPNGPIIAPTPEKKLSSRHRKSKTLPYVKRNNSDHKKYRINQPKK